jgi:cell division septal protein FtsQ
VGASLLFSLLPRNIAGSPRAAAEKSLGAAGYSESWRLSRPCSGVTTNDENTVRSQVWEDDVPAEPRVRRVQRVMPPSGAALPGLPLEMEDHEDEGEPVRPVRSRFSPPRNPWWRPASSVGRFFLTSAALIVLVGLGTSAYLLKTYLDHDARFRIGGASNIKATGLAEVSRAEMLPVFGEDIGRNVFFVPLNERRKQLEEIPWIEKATVMRLLPDQIRVTVVERQPVAFTRMGSQIGLVDANGVLLTMPAAMMAQHHYSFPTLSGINPSDSPATRKGRVDVYLRLLKDFDSSGQRLSAQVSEIDLTDPADARVTRCRMTPPCCTSAKITSWNAISVTSLTSTSGVSSIPTWRRWICAMTSRSCCRWQPWPARRKMRPAISPRLARNPASPRRRNRCRCDCRQALRP